MNAGQKVVKMLKEVYLEGDVNAAKIWKGYDSGSGRSGWHYQPFGQNAQYVGASVAEVKEYVRSVLDDREYYE